MASLGNNVNEQVVKAPQQNGGGGCRNEELQLEDILDNNNEVRDSRGELELHLHRVSQHHSHGRGNKTGGRGITDR